MFSVLPVIVNVPEIFLFTPVLPENSPLLNAMFESPEPLAVPELSIRPLVKLKLLTSTPLIPLCPVLEMNIRSMEMLLTLLRETPAPVVL